MPDPSEPAKQHVVLFISITFDPEPGAIRGLPMAKVLKERGYGVKVLTAIPWYPLGKLYPGYEAKPWQWETMDGIDVLRVGIKPSHDQSAKNRILTYLSFTWHAIRYGLPRVGAADLVYYFDNLPTTGFVAYCHRLRYRSRSVQHIADMWPESVLESGMLKKAWQRRLVEGLVGGFIKFLYRKHGAITVLSPGFKRMLVARGVPESKVEVIYNWADEDKFFPEPADPSLVADLGLDGKLNIVYAGNIGALQSLDTAVRAAALVKDDPTIQLVIIGAGPVEQEVKALAAELGADNVKFLGRRPVEEMNRINAMADALLVILRDIPFMYSTIPSKTQVSLACGKPILMGVKGDAADLIREAGAGVLFESENPASMAAAMRELASMSREAREEMGSRGRQYYENHLSMKIGTELTERVFAEVLAQ